MPTKNGDCTLRELRRALAHIEKAEAILGVEPLLADAKTEVCLLIYGRENPGEGA